MSRFILSMGFVLALGACVSFLPEPEAPTGLYRLGPVNEVSGLELDQNVLIRQPDAARVLSGVEIVALGRDGAVRIVNGVEWADRAPRLLQLNMLDVLNGDGQGHALLPESGAKADYQLSWRLADFSLTDRTATARIEFVLIDGKTRKPLAQETVSIESVAENGSDGARAEAMADAGRRAVEAGARFLVGELETDAQS
ncbi:MAG: ABC-type transport auxiliary lipoprotein family protein [Hyphomonadaceae bacterium]